MRIELVRAREISPELRAQWGRAQSSRSEFASPFFSPLFTEAVGALREDIFVGVLESGKEIGFFPFELLSPGIGRPPGGRVCDYQAVISSHGLGWTVDELLQGCGLIRYNYKRLLDCQPQFRSFHQARSVSALIDLQKGFEAYTADRTAAGSEVVKKVTVYRKKLERDHGPLRLETRSVDPKALDWLFAGKSAQYLRTGHEDQFHVVPWLKSFLRNVCATGTADFGGMLSVLWAGERIAAAHLGLRAKHVLHYWFPCYDITLKDYSPGLVLLMELAHNAAGCGISVIDLGRADAPYKQRFMSAGIAIAEGAVVVTAPNSEREQAYRANTSGVYP
jgi:CelD/BcsL family acetyltransferase involved in cellulose biosynthesis